MTLPRPVIAETAQVPSWKRTLDILVPNTTNDEEQPRKKRRSDSVSKAENVNTASTNGTAVKPATDIATSDGISKVLSQVDGSLAVIQQLEGLSEEAKHHASELRRLLYQDASKFLLKSVKDSHSSSATTTKKSHHTAVPAPIPGVTVMPASASHSPDLGNVRGWTLPPLPPITDLSLLNAPFTHSSTLPHYVPQTSTNTYEPLEFLGDAYLELMATKMIHNRFPMHNVGQKAGLRELLVKNETLAQFSKDYGMSQRITIPRHAKETMSTPKWTKILADMFEAYVACIVLSDEAHGLRIAEDWMIELWEPLIKEWKSKGEGRKTSVQEHMSHDIKGELQRYVVSRGVKLDYDELKPVEFEKATNRTTYFIGVYLTGWGYEKVKLGTGVGRSKQLAGSEAAKNAFAISRMILDDAHRKKLEHDALNLKKRQGFI